MRTTTILKLLVLLFISIQNEASLAQDKNTILEIYDIRPEQVIMKGFTLKKEMNIEVEARVGITNESDDLLSTCWILDADDRSVLWECDADNGKKNYRRATLKYQTELTLSEGNYEVYYALNPLPRTKKKGVFGHVFKGSEKLYSDEWGVTVKLIADDSALRYVEDYDPPRNEQAIVQIIRLDDDEVVKHGFSISKPLQARIYAIGEGSSEERQMYDYGWIVDANTNERIWEMTHRNTEHAGGAEKNRKFDGVINLPTGNYIVYFVTDDSHSPEKWNQLPPYDPYHWGITIFSEAVEWDSTTVKDYEEGEREPIVEITHVQNDSFEMKGFTLKREADLRIYALGEYSRSRRTLVDYGWIVDADTRTVVWKMDYHDTEHAGGSPKNRVFDNVVSFPAGSYLVYYVSDDSHAYDDWNEKRPYDPEAWGITIYPVDVEFSHDDVENYDEDEDRDILAQIMRVRDEANLVVSFSLDESANIQIYAIGEGDKDEMYDYAWIENESGKTVWKMKYRQTKHAGGAKKNRLFHDIISLDRGSYLVHYVTDDSHSYQAWNATPPDDQIHWGVTIIKTRD